MIELWGRSLPGIKRAQLVVLCWTPAIGSSSLYCFCQYRNFIKAGAILAVEGQWKLLLWSFGVFCLLPLKY